MTQQGTTWVLAKKGSGGNNPPSSPPLDLGGGTIPQEPPNGGCLYPLQDGVHSCHHGIHKLLHQ
jgi:hypothetical protein